MHLTAQKENSKLGRDDLIDCDRETDRVLGWEPSCIRRSNPTVTLSLRVKRYRIVLPKKLVRTRRAAGISIPQDRWVATSGATHPRLVGPKCKQCPPTHPHHPCSLPRCTHQTTFRVPWCPGVQKPTTMANMNEFSHLQTPRSVVQLLNWSELLYPTTKVFNLWMIFVFEPPHVQCIYICLHWIGVWMFRDVYIESLQVQSPSLIHVSRNQAKSGVLECLETYKIRSSSVYIGLLIDL